MNINVDFNKIKPDINKIYDGMGFISANNSSRLLMDYKYKQSAAYEEMLELVFGKEGLNISLFKLEMGADIDSSSGCEPAVKRSISEPANARRGAGYRLAADAKKINPDLRIDMLYWGIPAWIEQSDDKYKAMYIWYKETIEAMKKQYGICPDYVTLTRNEKPIDYELVKYLSNHIKKDYPHIKVVAGEDVCEWKIADEMLKDCDLLEAVDVVSAHYTSLTSENAKLLQNEYGKKLWFSEGSSPMKSHKYSKNIPGMSGIGGMNGVLDIATRITKGIAEGMTMYEFQPLISSYYDGATFYPKQLIKANEPWSGAYEVHTGFYMAMHFAAFIKPGDYFVKDACYGDGEIGGDGHAIVNSTYNYITAVSSDRKNYSVVIVNNTDKALNYHIMAPEMVAHAVRTNDNVPLKWDEVSYSGTYDITLNPYEIVTVTTLPQREFAISDRKDAHNILALPYCDDFNYDGDYIEERGMAPEYTTDQGGAFEVVEGGNVLQQMISHKNKAVFWGGDPEPVTTLGDDLWQNYSVSVDVKFGEDSDKNNYVGAGLYYNLADLYTSGYYIKLYADGGFALMKEDGLLIKTSVSGDITEDWHNLRIKNVCNVITCYYDGEQVMQYKDTGAVINSGRAALYSAFENNLYRNLKIEPEKSLYSVTRIDNFDKVVRYGGTKWNFEDVAGFRNYNRTNATGIKGCEVSFSFAGSHYAVIGQCEKAVLKVNMDGMEEIVKCPDSSTRRSALYTHNLENGIHNVKILVEDGTFSLNAIEFA